MSIDAFAKKLSRLSQGIVNFSCLTEDDDLTENEDVAVVLLFYKPLMSPDRMIRVNVSWTKTPAEMISACNKDFFLHVNISKNVRYRDGDDIEMHKTFRELMEEEKNLKAKEKKMHDIGGFRRAFLFISFEGNYRDSSESISSDEGPHPDYPGYDIGGPVRVLPENGAVLSGWYRVEIVNRLTFSVIKRLQAQPETTAFTVLEMAQLAKQCCFLIKTGSRFCPPDWTMDRVYGITGREEHDGSRTLILYVETARSGPDLLEADQEETEESDEDDQD